MGNLSILPADFSVIESWLARIFLVLGLITIAPWILILIYDFLLYVWRSITYEIPYVGGRARGKERPRAPSLRDRTPADKRQSEIVSSGGHDVGLSSATDSEEPVKRIGNPFSKQEHRPHG